MSVRTGHLQIREGVKGRVWVALWRDGDGRHKKTLGPAWVKARGTNERGGKKWRAANGPAPDGYLTPREAEEALAELLAAAPKKRKPKTPKHTFGDACAEWLRYVEHDRDRRESTVRDYRNTVRLYLLPHFGADTPIEKITTDDIDAFREAMLEEGRLSHRTIQKILVLL